MKEKPLVGASPRPNSLGAIVLDGFRQGGLRGAVHLVNPRHARIGDAPCLVRLADLPDLADLAILMAPADTVPSLVREAGARGCAGVMIMRHRLGHGPGLLLEEACKAARAYGL